MNKETKQLLTYVEAAKKLTVAPVTLRRWVSECRIPYIKIGRSVRFDPDDLFAWIEAQKVGGRK